MRLPQSHDEQAFPDGGARGLTRRESLALIALGLGGTATTAAAAPQGQLTVAVHVSLTPTWFDPAESTGIVTPYLILYALHDGMVKSMPDGIRSPSLAESYSMSKDGLTFEFVIRNGALFHNGDPVTSEDVKFSFLRYQGSDHSLLKQRVDAIETPDARHIRFKLKQPWPDFLTFYAGATGAGWIVPSKYVTKVGDAGFKKAPIGAGPYKFVSYEPGLELVLEAFEPYWRGAPKVKRIVMKVIPDESTRLIALKRGEVDIAYSIRGESAKALMETPGLGLKAAVVQGTFCVYFADQWDPKSPWHDQRVRHALSLAIDRNTINDALTLGKSRVTGSSIFPDMYEFYWQPPAPVFDPVKAKQLLATAGFPNGFDAGLYYCDSSYSNIGEAVVNNLQEVGIRVKLRPLERAAFIKGFTDKTYKNLIQAGPGAFGNSATRLESFVVKGGPFAYGSYPDIDELFPVQAAEMDPVKREAILHQMQRMVHERTMFAPIWQLGFLNGIGPRVGESSFGRIPGFPYTAPYDEITLKGS
ncbi:MAG: ABC transporter substrate-binding protein [Acetobacteraceae bacterium]|nr:ABC transporter substrate-binding protein [Acetobacteraceae bacterium]